MMMALLRALEGLVKKAETAELGSPALGPNGRDLSLNIKETKEAFFSRIHGLIGMMSQHLIALTNTVDSVDPERNDIIYGRSVDLKDSMENKVERLEMQIKKWERRINHFVQKGAVNSLSPLKEKIKKIGKSTKLKVGKMKGGRNITKQLITAEKIHRMEEAGNPPLKIRLKRLTNGLLGNLTTGSQTETQPETDDCQTCCLTLSHTVTHETNKPAGDYPQII